MEINLHKVIMLDQSVVHILFTTFGPLFAIANPFGAVPVFLDLVPILTKDADVDYTIRNKYNNYRNGQAILIAITVLITLILSLFAGQGIFRFFGINLSVVRIAGGLLIFALGWRMVSVGQSLLELEQDWAEPRKKNQIHYVNVVVPMAIPLISGPGAISVVIGQAQNFTEWTAYLGSSLAIVALSLFVWFCLYASEPIGRKLGRNGVKGLERIFGFIVLAIALEMLFHGILGVFQVYAPRLIEVLS